MITFQQIKDSNPLLIIYPGGSGGEFIADMISRASPSFNKLPSTYNKETNRTELQSPLIFQHKWVDIHDPETWVTPGFIHNGNNLRYVLRLHPDNNIVNNIYNHLPNIEIIYMTPLACAEYFSKLIYIKTSHQIKLPVSEEIIRSESGNYLDNKCLTQLTHWINSLPFEISSVELGELCYLLNVYGNLDRAQCDPDPMKFIRRYMYSIYLRYFTVCQELEERFNNVHMINADSLSTDSIEFWNKVKTVIPDLDIEHALTETTDWIYKNNKVIEKFDNDNNIRRD